jgi:hypothetical protein
MQKNTPWASFSLPSLAPLFGKAQKEKNNSTQKNKNKNKNKNKTNAGAGVNATNLANRLATLSLTAPSSQSSSSTTAIKPLTEEEIMAQAAKWEAENNAFRAAGKARWQAKSAALSRNNRTYFERERNRAKQYNQLAKLNENIINKQRLAIKSSPYGEYMSEMYPGAKDPTARQIMAAEERALAKEAQQKIMSRQLAKQQANKMYPGLKNKPLVINKLTYRKGRKNHKSTRKNRK